MGAPKKSLKKSHNKNAGSKQQSMRMMFVEEGENDASAKCNGNGIEKNSKCYCYPGFSGELCETTVECPSKCSGNGICSRGTCSCNPGFTSLDCSKGQSSSSAKKVESSSISSKKSCPNDCNFKGLCKGGVCWCKNGFTGPSCESPVDLSIETSAMNAQAER